MIRTLITTSTNIGTGKLRRVSIIRSTAITGLLMLNSHSLVIMTPLFTAVRRLRTEDSNHNATMLTDTDLYEIICFMSSLLAI